MPSERTEKFYRSVEKWVLEASKNQGSGFLLGVNGPQGSGKTTLTTALCQRLQQAGKSAVTISVDDFYLTRAEQARLASEHPRNPYLQQRGYPGTHDLALGASVLQALKRSSGGKVKIPRYDKSAHQGQGDRFPKSAFSEAETPVDLIFLEGWMLGFPPVDPSKLPNENFVVINEALVGYRDWHMLLDGFLQLVPRDPRFVLDWRVEAEQKSRAQGKDGMSDEQIRGYVEKFLPAYEIYLPALEQNPPVRQNVRRIVVDRDRLPLVET